MAYQEDLVDTQMVEKADEVADDVEHSVGGGGGRRVSVSISAEVGGDAAVAEGREVEKLVAPRVPELREAVEEEDRRACPYRRYVHVYAICAYSGVLYLLHLHLSLLLVFLGLSLRHTHTHTDIYIYKRGLLGFIVVFMMFSQSYLM
jgi:hypothetical protein